MRQYSYRGFCTLLEEEEEEEGCMGTPYFNKTFCSDLFSTHPTNLSEHRYEVMEFVNAPKEIPPEPRGLH